MVCIRDEDVMFKKMKSAKIVCILFYAFMIVACTNDKVVTYEGVPDDNNTLKGLMLIYDASDDYKFGGNEAIGIILTVKNNSGQKIENCIFIINDRYTASLENIEYYYGFMKGDKPLARSYIKQGELLEIAFSHDNNNHLIFKDSEKSMFPRSEKIVTLKITSMQGEGIWRFITDKIKT
jgi:hypothetical protein